MSVVGIDFGNDTCKIAVAHNRVITVVANEVSKRRTPSYVCYGEGERKIGMSAKAGHKSTVRSTIYDLKRFIGRPTSDPTLQQDMNVFYNIQKMGDRMGATINYRDEDTTFSFEQIVASLFTQLKNITSRGIDGKPVRDVVISCPPYFTEERRRAIKAAAAIAGLNVLRLMNETTAVALSYGILRPLPKDTTNRVVFVDVGQCDTSVAIVDFTEGKLTVKGTASDPSLGGGQFDNRIVDHFVRKFKQDNNGIDLRERKKAILRLTDYAEKIKKTLSSNSDAMLTAECVWDDYDLTMSLKREDFEKMCDDLFDRVLNPIKEVMAKTETSIKDVFAVEMVGGGIRIPAIQQRIADFFQVRTLQKTLNFDEACCRGCALMCASISPSFIVKKFEVIDCVSYPIKLAWGPIKSNNFDPAGINPDHESTLFYEKDAMPITKTIPFPTESVPYRLLLRYADPQRLPTGSTETLGAFTIDQIPKLRPQAEDLKKPTIKVKIPMNLHGLVGQPSATLVEQIWVEEEHVIEPPKKKDKKTKDKKNTKDTPLGKAAAAATDESKKEDDEKDAPAPMETDAGDNADKPAPMDTTEDAAEPATEQEASPASEPKEAKTEDKPAEPVKKIVKVKKKIKTPINIRAFWVGLPEKKMIDSWCTIEGEMIASDKLARDTADARNDLETYSYAIRDKLDEELRPYVEENARYALQERIEAMIDWLYDEEGENSTKSVYVTKLTELRKDGDEAEVRKREAEKRPDKVNSLKASIVKFQMFAQSDDEKYAHISAEDKDAVKRESTAVDTWLQDKLQEQSRCKLWDNPKVTCRDITSKLVAMSKVCQPIMDTPKPKPKPKKEEKADDKKENAGDKSTTTEPSAKPSTDTQSTSEGDKMDVDTETTSTS